MVLAVVCPGQGSQRNLAGAFPYPVPDGVDIDATEIAQPLIVSASLTSFCAQRSEVAESLRPKLVAGHSVGMLAAFAIAGAYSFETARELAEIRGRLFRDSATPRSSAQNDGGGGMSAVIGRDALRVFSELNSPLEVAVVNSDTQIVVAGPLAELDKLKDNAPRGLRISPLPVSGAFHTEAMRPAVDPFAQALASKDIGDPKIPVISDLTGEIITTGVIEHLLKQITNPVRWDLVTEQLKAHNPSQVIELAPSGTLTALLKRAGLPAIPVEQLTELETY